MRNFTATTSFGRTQCTRLKTRGDPKRVERGGGASSGIRLKSPPEPMKLGVVHAGADAAGVDQPAIGVVIGEQERAEMRPPPLGIGPADDDKFITVQAFDLAPQAAIARRVDGIDAFGDDPLDRHFAGMFVKGRAPPDVVIAVVERRTARRQQRGEPFLALENGLRSEILAVEVDQIEQEEHECRGVAGIGGELNDAEARDAVGGDAAQFAVEIGLRQANHAFRHASSSG